MDEFKSQTKIDLLYAEEEIIFDISDCTLTKGYSLFDLKKENTKSLIGKLKDRRKMTWKQFSSCPRGDGITPEKPGGKSFDMIHEENSCPNKIAQQHYFHFRIGAQHSTFRVFGYQYKSAFRITHLDVKGKIHGH